MTIETTLTKRRALYKGEIGFFPSSPLAEQDVALAKMDEELLCAFSSPRSLQQLKFLWALTQKVAENSDRFVDKDHAMEQLKIAAGHSRILFNEQTGELEVKPKSLRRLSFEQLRHLTDKIIDIVCSEIIPGMEENALRAEIETMIQPVARS
jgi:hypothetical protein